MMIGAHVLLYSKNPDADRAFLRDVLEFRSVDAGGGWLIFALPPAEIAVHPADAGMEGHTALYLMCDNLEATVKSLAAKKIQCSEIAKERWGIRTTIQLPSGSALGLYQPTHPTAF